MGDCEANSRITEITSSPDPVEIASIKNTADPVTADKNSVNRISKDYSSKNKNDNLHSHSHVGSINPALSENHIVSEGSIEFTFSLETPSLNGISKLAGGETNGSLCDSSVYPAGKNCNETDSREYSYTSQQTYDLTDKPRKSSLAGSDDSSNYANDSHKRRVKCLQLIGLTICAIVLSTVVIYYGWEPTQALRNFGETLEVARKNDLTDDSRVLEETIAKILLKIPKPQNKEEEVTKEPKLQLDDDYYVESEKLPYFGD